MALKLTGYLNIQTEKFFPIEELDRFALEYMQKNQDQFTKVMESDKTSETPAPSVILTVDELTSKTVVELKEICKIRGLTVGDKSKAELIDLIITDQTTGQE